MSDPSSPGSGPAAPTSSPKRRNPIERVFVWGLILVMGGLVTVEAYSKFSYDATVKSIDEFKDDADKDDKRATIEEYDELVSGAPRRVETDTSDSAESEVKSMRVDYTWFSLFKTYHVVLAGNLDEEGTLRIDYFDTNHPMEEGEPVALGRGSSGIPADNANGPGAGGGHGGAGHGGAGGPGGPGGGPGGPGGGPPGRPGGPGGPGPMYGGSGSSRPPVGDDSRPELEDPNDDESESDDDSAADPEEDSTAEDAGESDEDQDAATEHPEADDDAEASDEDETDAEADTTGESESEIPAIDSDSVEVPQAPAETNEPSSDVEEDATEEDEVFEDDVFEDDVVEEDELNR